MAISESKLNSLHLTYIRLHFSGVTSGVALALIESEIPDYIDGVNLVPTLQGKQVAIQGIVLLVTD